MSIWYFIIGALIAVIGMMFIYQSTIYTIEGKLQEDKTDNEIYQDLVRIQTMFFYQARRSRNCSVDFNRTSIYEPRTCIKHESINYFGSRLDWSIAPHLSNSSTGSKQLKKRAVSWIPNEIHDDRNRFDKCISNYSSRWFTYA